MLVLFPQFPLLAFSKENLWYCSTQLWIGEPANFTLPKTQAVFAMAKVYITAGPPRPTLLDDSIFLCGSLTNAMLEQGQSGAKYVGANLNSSTLLNLFSVRGAPLYPPPPSS